MHTYQHSGFLLLDVARTLRRTFHDRMAGRGLNMAQARALLNIARNPGIRQVDLAERLEVQPITLARLVDRLEQHGLVERRPHPQDRRAYQLYDTPKAEGYLDDITAVLLGIRDDAFVGLEDEDMETLRVILDRIYFNLNRRQARNHIEPHTDDP